MGAGILPTAIHNNKLYFLFGKENKYEESAPGFSDFGGGTDNNESYLKTAIREAGEELTGFLGNNDVVRKLLRKTYVIDHKNNNNASTKIYRMFIFPYTYDTLLPHYYNNNQQFLQKHLPEDIIKNSKIFEKAEIRWICVDELKHMRSQFRSYFQNIIDMILEQKELIHKFIKHNSIKNKTIKNKTIKNNKLKKSKTTSSRMR